MSMKLQKVLIVFPSKTVKKVEKGTRYSIVNMMDVERHEFFPTCIYRNTTSKKMNLTMW